MSGLQGSRWASNALATESKDKTDEKHPSVPSFGFQLPAVPRVTTAPQKEVPGPTGVPAGPRSTQPSTMLAPIAAAVPKPPTSAPTAARSMPTPAATSKPSEATKAPEIQLHEAPKKPLSRAEVAAAATRARMADIMGPRRRQGQASASKKQEFTGSSRYSNSDEK